MNDMVTEATAQLSINDVPVSEGKIPFEVKNAGKDCFTWYKVFGNLKSGERPVIALHGGPGVGHNYLLSLVDLTTKYSIPVIFYDQVGCGHSTRLKEKDGDVNFWTVELFVAEFNNVVKHFGLTTNDVWGNSWGGMLAAEIGITGPKGLDKIVIADSPASMQDWAKGAAKLKAQLPKDVRDTIDECEKNKDYDNPKFEEACMVFYKKHVCRLDPWPQDVVDAFANLDEDKTVYMTMNGPSEFTIVGSLKDWSVKGKLGAIKNDVLLVNGRYDEAVDEVVQPYWDELGGKVRWFTFAEGSHMPHWEEREKYMEVIAGFLAS